MIRATSPWLRLTCLASLALATTASAGNKPSIAVLGLEVVDQAGTPTLADTQAAKDLTEGLRSRAKAGSGPYQIAPSSDKELTDEKLLRSCDDEKPNCMSGIGIELGADMLMYGKIEKQGKAYQVTLKLLDVHGKAMKQILTQLIPLSQAQGTPMQGWAKQIYSKLTGQTTTGILVIKLKNADHGTILIDNENKGTITNGTGQVANLDEGKYKAAVETEGFHRWEQDVTIVAGQHTDVPVELEKERVDVGPGGGNGSGSDSRPLTPRTETGSTTWKAVFVAAVVVGVAGGGYWFYNHGKITDTENDICKNGGYVTTANGGQYMGSPPVSCSVVAPLNDGMDAQHAAQIGADRNSGQSYSDHAYIGGGIAIGSAVVAAFAFYKGFIAKSETSSEHADAGHRVRRAKFAVTPIISPNGGGATLQFDW